MISANTVSNVFCVILLLLLVSALPKKNHSIEIDGLKIVYLMACVYMSCEALWAVVNGSSFLAAVTVNKVLNVADLTAECLLGYLWMRYFEMRFVKDKSKTLSDKWYGIAPFAVMFGLCVASVFNGWFFNIDENNIYHRGPMYIIELLLLYLYPFITSVQAVILRRKARTSTERQNFTALGVYIVFPAVCGVIQVIMSDLLLTGFGITLGLVNVFVRLQEQKITRDSLTRLNNRYRLDRHLLETTSDYRESGEARGLYMIMMDINKFKGINDNYGHTEGDRALCLVADALSKYCEQSGLFLARYGGDEFTVVCESNELAIQLICDKLKEAVGVVETDAEYELSISAGYAKYDSGKSIDKWIAAADEELYEDKHKAHNVMNSKEA